MRAHVWTTRMRVAKDRWFGRLHTLAFSIRFQPLAITLFTLIYVILIRRAGED